MVLSTVLPAIMATTVTIILPEAVPQAHSVVPSDMLLENIIMLMVHLEMITLLLLLLTSMEVRILHLVSLLMVLLD